MRGAMFTAEFLGRVRVRVQGYHEEQESQVRKEQERGDSGSSRFRLQAVLGENVGFAVSRRILESCCAVRAHLPSRSS